MQTGTRCLYTLSKGCIMKQRRETGCDWRVIWAEKDGFIKVRYYRI